MSDFQKPRPKRATPADPIQAHLGEKLREFYGSILAEPVPDRLMTLLDQLEQQERAGKSAPASDEG